MTHNFKKNVTGDLKIAVFASGRGSNFEAILKAIQEGRIRNAGIVCVVSNNSTAGALETARRNGIPALHISRQQYESDADFDRSLLEALGRHGANFIALAGYIFVYTPLKRISSLATVVGVLVEVPVMLSVCNVCNRTRHWFAEE